VLHERIVLITIQIEDAPRVASAERAEIEALPLGFHRVVIQYGFMQNPNVPVALRFCERLGLDADATFRFSVAERNQSNVLL